MLTLRILLTSAMALAIAAQAPTTPPKPPGPDDVVATVEGVKLTPRAIQKIRSSLPPPFSQSAARMDNKAFLKSYAGLLKLSRLAESEKLAEVESYKDQLAFLRMNFLAQAYINSLKTKVNVPTEEVQKYYDDHQGDYQEAHVKAIYIAFSPTAAKQPPTNPKAKKVLTEQEAKVKAAALAAELKKGADFAEAAKKNSDDSASAEKGGDIGPIKRAQGGVPIELRDLIFKLKPGEVSDVVRQPAGFYIFKLEKIHTSSFLEVGGTIAQSLQDQKVQAEYNKILSGIQIIYDNEAFFNEPPPAPKN